MTELVVYDDTNQTPIQKWQDEIVAAEELEKFYKRGRVVTKKFLDERDNLDSGQKWFNIFYANTNILESALYAQLPKPAVSRKYTDYNDDVGRVAALIERVITQDLDDPRDNFDSMLRHCVQDRLVPGPPAAWLRLETQTKELTPDPTPGSDPEVPPQEEVTDQRVIVDYVYWQDFLWSPCRVWEERRWVARKVYMDRAELIKRFGEKKGGACPLNFSVNQKGAIQDSTPKEDIIRKAIVYEIWCRVTRKVYWVCKGYIKMLDEQDDFLGLVGFEPCPRPMLANTSTSNTTPRPDYFMLQDQYVELDNINNRISMLVKACKVVGVYDKASGQISRMLREGFDNQLIPADNWAMFAEKGGIKGAIDWLPLEQVVTAIRELNSAREVIKGQIYELTGIADIVRGASKASETLGAQQIKAQFASVRIKKLQDEVARFASDVMRIKAELAVKHFTPEILVKKSNIAVTGNDEFVLPALELLQTEAGFEWRIQITADTMAQADYAMEKQDRIAMLEAVTSYMAKAGPMMGQAPATAPIMINLLKWAIAGFRGAKDIEGMLDKELDNLQKMSKQPPPKTPQQQEAEAEQQRLQQEHQMELQKQQMELQAQQQEAMLEKQRLMMEMFFERQRQQSELAAENQRLDLERQRMEMEVHFAELMGRLKVKQAIELGEAKLEATKEAGDEKARQAKETQSKPD